MEQAVSMVLAAFAGAAAGSFSGVVAHRAPCGEGLGGRSRCACGRQLSPWENVPVLGYAAARGRARCCGAPIGWWNLGFELLHAAAAAAAWRAAGWPGVAAALLALVATTFLSAAGARARGSAGD